LGAHGRTGVVKFSQKHAGAPGPVSVRYRWGLKLAETVLGAPIAKTAMPCPTIKFLLTITLANGHSTIARPFVSLRATNEQSEHR
jgi:hypothetical protein